MANTNLIDVPPDLLKQILSAPVMPTPSILEMLSSNERWPHIVHYLGFNLPIHVPPDRFFLAIGRDARGLSECEWIVPGTTP